MTNKIIKTHALFTTNQRTRLCVNPALAALLALIISGCVSVPNQPNKLDTQLAEQNCQQREAIVADIAERFNTPMSDAAISRVIVNLHSQAQVQKSEVDTLIYYMRAAKGLNTEQYQAAYRQWCQDSIVKNNATAWLPDYFSKISNLNYQL